MSAVLLRAVGFVVLATIAGCVALYVFTGERRWLVWARRLFVAALAIAGIVLAFLVLERLVLAV